jgi:hypothetical protein
MMVDTRVYGLYIEDGGIVHNDDDCAGDILFSDSSNSYAIRDVDGTLTPAQPIYSIDDTLRLGTTCDSCMQYIFEPDYLNIVQDEVENIINDLSKGDAFAALLELVGEDHREAIAEAMDSTDALWRRAGILMSDLDAEEVERIAPETAVWERGE